VTVAVGPGPELLDDPGAQGGRRVDERVADGLRSGCVLLRVAGVPFGGVLERGDRGSLALGEVVERGRVRRRQRVGSGGCRRRDRGPAGRRTC
jgi:hypothetical protein